MDGASYSRVFSNDVPKPGSVPPSAASVPVTATVVSMQGFDYQVSGNQGGSSDVPVTAEVVSLSNTEDDGYVAMASSVFEPTRPLYNKVRHWNVLCFLFTIASFVTLVGWGSHDFKWNNDHDWDEGLISHNWGVAFIVSYSFMLLECFISGACGDSTLSFLCNMDMSSAYENEHQKFDELRRNRPRIVMSISCYHYETRTRVVEETYHENGERRTRTKVETYQEKVTTFHTSTDKIIGSWVDMSGNGPHLADIEGHFVGLQVSLDKVLDIEDDGTRDSLAMQTQTFLNMHKYRDMYYDYHERVVIEGFQRNLFLVDRNNSRWYMSVWVYVICSFLFLSWPFRRWVQHRTMQTSWTLRKRISMFPGLYTGITDGVMA
mmetsp:Transcript_15291/g.24868  ORF Transcript_15291/g.24868 Transcript_15291/m.24868 type:complete len:376 (-) Transcript_15291:529-1656(-)|eukprot:CAMPEP_0203744486 /NCGR_PEP_ID=MMETSP0098-20131031/535_1 /ASSEMBLY_ACC=CAM_ASM_000208 /TAXON_ID=96639 /ORGANISM=" , Strain NY0313808BC1" /LENGTH=375 /DNA_ID=CAMNT_0050632013 /DNA_START=428 /DNA_END=1555 /DNA_ORIENTATION=-